MGRTGEEIRQAREDCMAGDRFGKVKGYDGDRLNVPEVLALAHLRCGGTYAQLTAGFSIGIATVYPYIREAIGVLAALAPALAEVMTTASTKAFMILDGTLLPIDRIAADTPYCSGRHKRHGMNDQVLTDPFGCLLWASLCPSRSHPRSDRRWLKRRKRRRNSGPAKIRCAGEQAMAAPKGWRLLRKLRCITNRIPDLVNAADVLHHTST
ncbi:hypothetical protein GGE06_002619 [Streptomyces sp. SFB5A]|uniref:Transposase n=1 Tax=Streptomyces nymphaeiformis TaxID=2663842 RepID=A0A7W7XAP8_9ACTN|nr:hypothetical protein [Streptomyces nymphaeiformis]